MNTTPQWQVTTLPINVRLVSKHNLKKLGCSYDVYSQQFKAFPKREGVYKMHLEMDGQKVVGWKLIVGPPKPRVNKTKRALLRLLKP